MSTELQTTSQQPAVVQWLASPSTLAQLKTALPSHFPAERMARLALTAFRTNRALQNCSPASVMASIMSAAQLGLEPHVQGQCYLVPHGNECTLIVGYQGLLDLIRRSGQVKSLAARVVYASDAFSVSYHTTPPFTHQPNLRRDEKDQIVGVYCHAILTSDEHVFEWMSAADVNAIRNRARAGKSGPWASDWSEMARKTVLKRAAKYLPKSVSLVDALDITDRAEAPAYVDATQQAPVAVVRAAHAAQVPSPPPADDDEAPAAVAEVVPFEDEGGPL
jgi:recombination protein RecT